MVLVSPFGWPIVRSVSHFSIRQKKIVLSQRLDIFLSTLLNFFFQPFLKIVHSLISRVDKKSQESRQKKCPVSKMGQSFWPTPKNEKLTEQLVGQETDQNHIDVPWFSKRILFWVVNIIGVKLLQKQFDVKNHKSKCLSQ